MRQTGAPAARCSRFPPGCVFQEFFFLFLCPSAVAKQLVTLRLHTLTMARGVRRRRFQIIGWNFLFSSRQFFLSLYYHYFSFFFFFFNISKLGFVLFFSIRAEVFLIHVATLSNFVPPRAESDGAADPRLSSARPAKYNGVWNPSWLGISMGLSAGCV